MQKSQVFNLTFAFCLLGILRHVTTLIGESGINGDKIMLKRWLSTREYD